MKPSLILFAVILAACSEHPQQLESRASRGVSKNATGVKESKPVPTSDGETETPDDKASNDPTTGDNDDPSKDTGNVDPTPPDDPVVEISPTTGIAKVAVSPSPGCSKNASQELGKYVRKNVTGMERTYQLYLPKNYNKSKPYRLFMIGHGCGGNDAPFKLESVAKDQAIIVAMKSAESCFVYEMGVEGPYFDKVLDEVSNDTCIDTNRVFVAGFSSGSWLTNMLGCARSNVIRAQGNASGGLPSLPACQGPIPAFMVHDEKDPVNAISGGERARDRILKINSCSNQTEPYEHDDDPKTEASCVRYLGCKPGFPVIWCTTSKGEHTPSEAITTPGLWKFWSGF